MPKKRQPNTHTQKRILEEIDQAFPRGWLVKSSLHGYFKKDDSIRAKWDKMMDEMTRLRSFIRAEI
jgi:hypothetical protein